MNTSEFIQKYRRPAGKNSPRSAVRPRVVCADGFSISIQAGFGLFSMPRKDAREYARVELQNPSAEDQDIITYAERPNTPTKSAYGYVPVYIVDALLEKHGGIVGIDTSNCPDAGWKW